MLSQRDYWKGELQFLFEKVRTTYLQVTKQRRMGLKKMRKAIGKQLACVARNLRHVEQLQAKTSLTTLGRKQ